MTSPPSTPLAQVQAVAQGVALLFLLHLLAIAGLWVLLYLAGLGVYILSGVANSVATQQLYRVWLFGLLAFGLVQWLYVLPVLWWLQQQRKATMAWGLLGGAIATTLLNGGYLLWHGGLGAGWRGLG